MAAERYETPTPIQAQAIPPVMQGRDVLGCAQTGTGKTAAFALPILHRLTGGAAVGSNSGKRPIRSLVLAPTRELAGQILESFRTYGRYTPLRYAVVFGGVSQFHQTQALKAGVDVLIATPGRLLDLMEQGFVDLRHVEVLVLDEADHMLDMGFIHDIRKVIAKLPAKRQNLLFSATMPAEIRELADSILRNPARVQVASASPAADTVQQSVYFVAKRNKPVLLAHYLANNGTIRTLVFMRTKHGADRVVRHLVRVGIRALAIHGNKNQNARNRALADFKSQRPPVLVATDIAARGLDIDDVARRELRCPQRSRDVRSPHRPDRPGRRQRRRRQLLRRRRTRVFDRDRTTYAKEHQRPRRPAPLPGPTPSRRGRPRIARRRPASRRRRAPAAGPPRRSAPGASAACRGCGRKPRAALRDDPSPAPGQRRPCQARDGRRG